MNQIANLMVTTKQAKDAISELTEIHQPRSVPISAPYEGRSLGFACVTCDEVWPCSTAVVVAGFTALVHVIPRMEQKIRQIAEDEKVAMSVWRAWYSQMYLQGREVSDDKMTWKRLSESDKALDQAIAIAVVEKILEILSQE